MPILEPPTTFSVTYDSTDQAYYAEGFLLSTRRSDLTKTNPTKGIKISKQAGHDIAKSYVNKYFMIDPQKLKQKGDGHFYGFSKEALIEGYKKKGYGQIKAVKGPFYYSDEKDGDYWYNFRMRLKNGAAAQALYESGKDTMVPFSVSPHIWDEKVSKDGEILEGEGVGVALVIKGAWYPEATLSSLCKGTETSCFGPAGIAGAMLAPCEFGCSCDACKDEDKQIAQIISSIVGSAGSNLSGNIDSMPTEGGNNQNPPGSVDSGKGVNDQPDNMDTKTKGDQLTKETSKNNDNKNTNTNQEPQDLLTSGPKGMVMVEAEELEELRATKESHKLDMLNGLFADVSDEKERKKMIEEHSKLSLAEIKALKLFREKLDPHVKEKLKAQLLKEAEDEVNKATADEKDGKNKRGRAGSSLPPEKPKEKTDATSGKEKEGQAGSKKFTPSLRSLMNGGRKF